ncbi:MAG: MarR family winged helix-turn-helix transcriptional regulator [Acidimicrobiales bacterium]
MTTTPAVDTGALDAVRQSMQDFGRMVSLGKVYEAVLRRSRIDLSRADVQLLHILSEAGDGIRLGEVAERLGVDAPTVTRRAQQLESRGLLRRAADPLDKRAQLVQLTAAGTRSVERTRSVFRRWLEEVLADWTGSERLELAALLERFTHDVHSELECHGH